MDPSALASSITHTTRFSFVDDAGRTLLLRGVNLSASSKAPVGMPSWVHDGFWPDENPTADDDMSFLHRPFNLDDGSADIHLARLRGWGFNMLRFPITWEALEHAGPGQYDTQFMDYTIRVLAKCADYGFRVYIDPHQDVWSRFSGGSGAPYWTLLACGIDPHQQMRTGGAVLHCEWPADGLWSTNQAPPEYDPSALPAMVWSTNYGRLVSQTMFTLFFAGRDFAPRAVIDDVNIQDWLQQHFIDAFSALAERIKTYDEEAGVEDGRRPLRDACILGWDSMNEPFEGLCGWDHLNTNPTAQGGVLRKGTYPTPAQSFRLGMGQKQTLDYFEFGSFGPKKTGTVDVDPCGAKLWSNTDSESPHPEGGTVHSKYKWHRAASWQLGTCIWALHGVWDLATGFISRPDYFRYRPIKLCEVDFIADYWKPHFVAFAKRIRYSHPRAILFVQPPVFAEPPLGKTGEREVEDETADNDDDILQGRAAYSAHYYDGLTLVTRHWNWFNADALGLLRGKYSSTLQAVKIGERAIRRGLQDQIGMLQDDVRRLGGAFPLIVGEIGTPFDMDSKRSYGWTDGGRYKGDYSRQQSALDASLNGADGPNCVNYTIWTYAPDHCHDWGDGWNMEDLSVWSEDDLASATQQQQSEYVQVCCGSKFDASYFGVSTMFGAGPDDSKAILLKKSGTSSSSSSLATLGQAGLSSTTLHAIRSRRAEQDLEAWHASPYTFLTDGARAVKAFCRPYPIAVVGRSKYVDFDINKASFKLTVVVSADDRPFAHRDPRGSDQCASGAEELATEIFVPLVHFASE
ncbi:glycoside hydrolase, partial [Fistulina hepatica ATCC 64428]